MIIKPRAIVLKPGKTVYVLTDSGTCEHQSFLCLSGLSTSNPSELTGRLVRVEHADWDSMTLAIQEELEGETVDTEKEKNDG